MIQLINTDTNIKHAVTVSAAAMLSPASMRITPMMNVPMPLRELVEELPPLLEHLYPIFEAIADSDMITRLTIIGEEQGLEKKPSR